MDTFTVLAFSFPVSSCFFAYLVSDELGLDIVLKGTITLVLVGNKGTELLRELLKVVQVVHTETGAGGLGRVGWADTLTGGTNATMRESGGKKSSESSRLCPLQFFTNNWPPVLVDFGNDKFRICFGNFFLPSASQFKLLESVNNLVDIKDKMSSVRDKEASSAIETCNQEMSMLVRDRENTCKLARPRP